MTPGYTQAEVDAINESVWDFRIRELELYVAARRAWKLKRRRATWGPNAWRVTS